MSDEGLVMFEDLLEERNAFKELSKRRQKQLDKANRRHQMCTEKYSELCDTVRRFLDSEIDSPERAICYARLKEIVNE